MPRAPHNVLYAPPVIRRGLLRRGVAATDDPGGLLGGGEIVREKWVLLLLFHAAIPPSYHPEVDLYQIDPFFRDRAPAPQVFVLPRDLTDPDAFRPLGGPKPYDIVFNATWHEVKRPGLLVDALTYARDHGRPIRCLWFGYHWHPDAGAIEARVVAEVRARDLPVTFEPPIFDPGAVNRRYNLARAAVSCSAAEGGPRVMAEAMLAGLPFLATRDTYGCSAGHLTGRNGHTSDPTPESLAEGTWHVLDHLDQYRPREWALQNMCLPVGLERLRGALARVAEQKGWQVNLEDLAYNGIDWDGQGRQVQRADAGCPA